MPSREDIIRKAEKFELRGRWDRAIREYRKLLEDKSDDPRLLNRIGDLLSRTGEIDEALRLFRQVATYYEREGLLHKAVATNKKIHKLHAGDAAVVEKLCELYARQGLQIEAKSHLLALARLYSESGQNDRVLDVYQRLVDLEPGNHELRLNLADLLRRDGRKQQAFAEYLRIGKLYADKGHHREGAAALEKALAIDPVNPEVVRRLTSYHLEQNQPDRAERLLHEGLSRAPESTFLLLLQAKIRAQAGRIDEALDAYLRLLDSDPDVSDGLEELTQTALGLEDPEARSRFFEKLHDKFIQCARPERAAQTLLALARGERAGSQVLERVRDLVRQVEREEHRLPLLCALAEGYRQADRPAAEREALEELLEIDPLRYKELVRLKELRAGAAGASESEPELTSQAVTGAMSPAEQQQALASFPLRLEGRQAYRDERFTTLAVGLGATASPGERTEPHPSLQPISAGEPAPTAAPVPELAGALDFGPLETMPPAPRDSDELELLLPSFSELAPQLEDMAAQVESPRNERAEVPLARPESFDEEALSQELDQLSQSLRGRAGRKPAAEPGDPEPPAGSARVIHAAAAFGAEAAARRPQERSIAGPDSVVLPRLAVEDGSSYYELGMAFKEMDLIDDAFQEFALASQDPKLREPASKMAGICCMQNRKYGQAIEWFERAEDAGVENGRKPELQQLIAKARELLRGQRGFKVSVLS